MKHARNSVLKVVGLAVLLLQPACTTAPLGADGPEGAETTIDGGGEDEREPWTDPEATEPASRCIDTSITRNPPDGLARSATYVTATMEPADSALGRVLLPDALGFYGWMLNCNDGGLSAEQFIVLGEDIVFRDPLHGCLLPDLGDEINDMIDEIAAGDAPQPPDSDDLGLGLDPGPCYQDEFPVGSGGVEDDSGEFICVKAEMAEICAYCKEEDGVWESRSVTGIRYRALGSIDSVGAIERCTDLGDTVNIQSGDEVVIYLEFRQAFEPVPADGLHGEDGTW